MRSVCAPVSLGSSTTFELHRHVDVVVVDDLARLSRDVTFAVPLVFGRLAEAGVSVLDVSSGLESSAEGARASLMQGMMTADGGLQSLRWTTRRGLAGRVRAGASAGGTRYGFRSVRLEGASGSHWVIDEHEAAVVARVFQEFTAGRSMRAVARGLTTDGIPGPRASRGCRGWAAGTVKSLLTNVSYTGVLVWGRTRRLRTVAGGWKKAPQEASEKIIRSGGEDLRIISDELWRAAEERLRQDHARRGRPTGTGGRGSPLLGVLVCGACGAAMTTVGRKAHGARLGCSRRARKGTILCDGVRTLNERRLVPALASALALALSAANVPMAQLIMDEVNAARAGQGASLDLLRREARRWERKQASLVAAIANTSADADRARQALTAELERVVALCEEATARLAERTAASEACAATEAARGGGTERIPVTQPIGSELRVPLNAVRRATCQ